MDKTIKINLGGILFQIDEEGYKMLRGYLQNIDARIGKTQGGAETIEDIESRIAEIFQSQKSLAGIITAENVKAMISIIGKPEDFDISADDSETRESFSYISSPKKLYKNPDDTILSGVCGGIGAYLNIEPVWIRIMFILFACFLFIGVLVYIALWIALPSALSETQKKEMYGGRINSSRTVRRKNDSISLTSSSYKATGPATSNIGNAFNEVFRAIGKVFYIFLRVILILIGITFVITGFISLVSFIMIFFFKYPGYFSTYSHGFNLFYMPDFLNYVVNPAVAPWILILGFIVVLMPLLAIIYWGVKMIFWFRAKDGIFALVGLILWVTSLAALSLILFNEGISYSENGRTEINEVVVNAPDNLYIMSSKKVSDLDYDKDISIPENNYSIYFKNENRGLFIGSELGFGTTDDNSMTVNIRKRSMGRSRSDATRKADELVYNYRISADTLFLDEYFSIPRQNKWSFDEVRVRLNIPEGTIVHFDKTTLKMFRPNDYYDYQSDPDYSELIWEMTEDGLRPGGRKSGINK